MSISAFHFFSVMAVPLFTINYSLKSPAAPSSHVQHFSKFSLANYLYQPIDFVLGNSAEKLLKRRVHAVLH